MLHGHTLGTAVFRHCTDQARPSTDSVQPAAFGLTGQSRLSDTIQTRVSVSPCNMCLEVLSSASAH
jgi:hypothetical protein